MEPWRDERLIRSVATSPIALVPVQPRTTGSCTAGFLIVAGWDDSDGALVARIAAGDEAAFNEAYNRHADVVYGSVVRFLRDRELAEEVVQDVYLSAWRHAGQYAAASGSLLGWLLGIARHRAIDRLRATARRPRLVVVRGRDDDPTLGLDRAMAAGRRVDPPATSSAGPEDAALLAWTQAVVRTALSTLALPEREALRLAYEEGLTQVEIAVRLGWPLGTVKTRTRRGLATMRDTLGGVPDLVDGLEAVRPADEIEHPIPGQAADRTMNSALTGDTDAAR
ncbi:MAG: sigma-70 family RNA polymerase sigma factor [Gemmatimonadales bacterium]